MNNELLTGLITAIITLIGAAAFSAKVAASEKKLFLEMVRNQEKQVNYLNRKCNYLEKKITILSAKNQSQDAYAQAVEKKLNLERDDCNRKILELQTQIDFLQRPKP